ncbi:MAG: hypothetical protein BAJALOKI3v1_40037 [Promethearchaeota archaeon]|jgi:hypothetical protein|nr:MAG: hypothetical protein BAJALOKI3v1_40037 [Candidatus Lokiarchaeota archaeon]
MMDKIFEYKSDWYQYFESVLKNEYSDEERIQNQIKGNIIESNFDSIEEFGNRYDKITIIPSKEENFFNVLIKSPNNEDYFIYADTTNHRFWILHNIESQKIIKSKIEDLFWNSYLQDRIYLTNQMLTKYWKIYSSDSMGVSIKFKQLFFDEGDPIKEKLLNYTMRLWPKQANSMQYFIDNINLPINFNSLNYVFEDIDKEIIIKEDFYRNGRFTINKGYDFHKHLDFIELIRDDYNSKIELIENYRTDWRELKGQLYRIQLKTAIDPQKIYKILMKNRKIFKIIIFEQVREKDFILYNCIDEHTGGRFTLQIFMDKLFINLNSDSCGNIILRLFSNLQTHLDPNIELEVDNENINLAN